MEKINVKENKKYFSKIGFLYLLFTAIVFFVQIGFVKMLYQFYPDFTEKNSFLIIMLSMYVIAMPLGIFLITRMKKEVVIEKKKLTFFELIRYFLISFAAMYISNIIGNIFIQIIAKIKQGEITNAITEMTTSNQMWVNILIVVICAPVFEEIIFRKLLIERTAQYGEKLAVLLSGFLFGLYHGNLYQFFYAFVLGCIFAYIFLKTGNLIYSIILHMIINFFGSVVSVSVLKYSGILQVSEKLSNASAMSEEEIINLISSIDLKGLFLFLGYMIIVFTFVVLGIIFFAFRAKYISFESGEKIIEKGKAFSTVFINIGMGIFILFWIGFIIFSTIV